jgi:hypothetical protein
MTDKKLYLASPGLRTFEEIQRVEISVLGDSIKYKVEVKNGLYQLSAEEIADRIRAI